LGNSLTYADELSKVLDVNVFCYEYTGFGHSQAATPSSDGESTIRASESNLNADIHAAFMYLTEKCGVAPKDVILFGRSLGSGPSCYLASVEPVGGLVIISGFASCLGVAMPWFKLDFKYFNMFNNMRRMRSGQIRCPVLTVHGRRDTIVPLKQSKSLLKAAPVQSFCPYYPDVSHCGVEDDWSEVCEYYSEYLFALRTGQLASAPKCESRRRSTIFRKFSKSRRIRLASSRSRWWSSSSRDSTIC
jgi:fermentation-respiration switch protein FrsA (DUF1100 family)